MHITSPKRHHNRNMMKEFTPLGLLLLGPTSISLGISIMIKFIKMCVYNAQILLRPTPMSLECPKVAT